MKTTFTLLTAGILMFSCGQEKKNDTDVATDMAANTEMSAAAESAEKSSWDSEASKTEADPTIVEIATGNEQFSTLVTALGAAELVGTLSSEGPFTVFAPTNAAFEKLPAGTVEALLKKENAAKLTKVLTYHVVAGEYKAEAVIKAINDNNNAFPVKTVEGTVLTLSLKDGNVMLTDAAGNMSTVIQPDVDASNGVIHVIDSVVMPE
ncbi:fasciclin domain-containing protein [Robiginitalea sp. SC105]|uniref:fasciclin domain-containing protein n=1 Tax=Robiginitalea sp. SC105 TaxID=2762332 RepID=UPI00351C2972